MIGRNWFVEVEPSVPTDLTGLQLCEARSPEGRMCERGYHRFAGDVEHYFVHKAPTDNEFTPIKDVFVYWEGHWEGGRRVG